MRFGYSGRDLITVEVGFEVILVKDCSVGIEPFNMV